MQFKEINNNKNKKSIQSKFNRGAINHLNKKILILNLISNKQKNRLCFIALNVLGVIFLIYLLDRLT